MTEKYEDVFLESDQKLKRLMVEKNCFMEKNYARIDVNTDDNIPMNKQIKFPTQTIIIRYIFEESGRLYPQIYLDECLYKL